VSRGRSDVREQLSAVCGRLSRGRVRAASVSEPQRPVACTRTSRDVQSGSNTLICAARSVSRLMYSTGGKAIYADKAVGESILTSSDLDWTLAYPVRLTNKPATGKARVIDLADLTRLPGMPTIPRADVAAFLLRAAVDDTWSRRTAVLTSDR